MASVCPVTFLTPTIVYGCTLVFRAMHLLRIHTCHVSYFVSITVIELGIQAPSFIIQAETETTRQLG